MFGKLHLLDAFQAFLGLIDEPVGVDPRPDRNHHRHQNPGDRSVDAGREYRQPDTYDQQVKNSPTHARLDRDEQRSQQHCSDHKGEDVNFFGVENCDHRHRSEVVGDCEGGQEHLESERSPGPKYGEDAKGKGDVGGHRDAPTARTFTATIDQKKEHRRHHHATNRRCHWQSRLVEG